MARSKDSSIGKVDKPRLFETLQMPVGLLNIRQKKIWREITSELNPGHVAHGAEVKLLIRLVKSYWRVELLEAELEEIFQRNETTLALNGNGAVTVHPIMVGIEKTNATIATLSTKLRLCPHSRLASRTATATPHSVAEPPKVKDEIDELFAH